MLRLERRERSARDRLPDEMADRLDLVSMLMDDGACVLHDLVGSHYLRHGGAKDQNPSGLRTED